METIKSFWDCLVAFLNSPLMTVIEGVSFLGGLLFLGYLWFCSVLGFTPFAFRLGVALWRRRIAIVGSVEAFSGLQDTLVDSGLFKRKRIHFIGLDKIEKLRSETLLLVDWATAEPHIDQIFSYRRSINTAVVIFAKPGSIPQDKIADIVDRPNTVVVNSRGRLLNDILTSLMTTSYDNK